MKFCFLVLVFWGFSTGIFSQETEADSLLKQLIEYKKGGVSIDKFEINKIYNPELNDAKKLEFEPRYESAEVEKIVFDYKLKPQSFSHQFESPFSFKDVEIERDAVVGNNLYLKLGYGVYNNLHTDASFSRYNRIAQGFEIFAHHRSSEGGIANTPKNGFSKSHFGAKGVGVFRSSKLAVNGGYKFWGSYRYGNTGLNESQIKASEICSAFGELYANIDYSNRDRIYKPAHNFLYTVIGGFRYLATSYSEKETIFSILGNLGYKPTDNFSYGIESELVQEKFFTDHESDFNRFGNNTVAYLHFKSQELNMKIGGGISSSKTKNFDTEVGFVPRLQLLYDPQRSNYSMELLVNGGVEVSTLADLSSKNPFLYFGKRSIFYEGIKNRREMIDASFNFTYKVNKSIAFNVGSDFRITEDEVFYEAAVRKTIPTFTFRAPLYSVFYEVVQDKAQLISPFVKLSLKDLADKPINMWLTFNYNLWDTDNLEKPLEKPEFEILFKTSVAFSQKKGLASVGLNYLGKRYQRDLNSPVFEFRTLDPYFSINISAKYRFYKNLAAYTDIYIQPSNSELFGYYLNQPTYFTAGIILSLF